MKRCYDRFLYLWLNSLFCFGDLMSLYFSARALVISFVYEFLDGFKKKNFFHFFIYACGVRRCRLDSNQYGTD